MLFDFEPFQPGIFVVVTTSIPRGIGLDQPATASTGTTTWVVTSLANESATTEPQLLPKDLVDALEDFKRAAEKFEYRQRSNLVLDAASPEEERCLLARAETAARASLAHARTARSAPRSKYRPVDRIVRWMGHVRH